MDDPFSFGQIAAANALSDVYAMGGTPLTAMNICAFPSKKFPLSVLSMILKGGLDILNQAGVQLLGGHTIEDTELKYGLSVTGYVHPDRILKNCGLADGDCLVLTKPLGTGIIGTAVKAGMADEKTAAMAVKSMTTLNMKAAEVMKKFPVHACTDITGFGLAGHVTEMVSDDHLEAEIFTSALPVFDGIRDLCETGMLPGGLFRNRKHFEGICTVEKSVPSYLADTVFDPQTSGGLLIALPEQHGEELVSELKKNGTEQAAVAGRIRSSEKPSVRFV